MSVTVVDDDIVQPRRFKSMHGTDSCWNCDSDYGQHQDGYCPDNDNYEPTEEELDAHYKAIAEPYKGAL